jgi:hypothetical protein
MEDEHFPQIIYDAESGADECNAQDNQDSLIRGTL